MQLWHLYRLVGNHGCITSNQAPSNVNHNITDDYTYIAFDNHMCDNISTIIDVVMAINGATAIMLLAMVTTHTVSSST